MKGWFPGLPPAGHHIPRLAVWPAPDTAAQDPHRARGFPPLRTAPTGIPCCMVYGCTEGARILWYRVLWEDRSDLGLYVWVGTFAWGVGKGLAISPGVVYCGPGQGQCFPGRGRYRFVVPYALVQHLHSQIRVVGRVLVQFVGHP